MSINESLKGKVALVTGAGQGLGEEIARELAARGAHVVLTDIQQTGEAVAADISSHGPRSIFIKQDVSDEAQWITTVETAMKEFGKVDILVNNAGLIQFAPIEEMTSEFFDRVIKVNVRGVWLGCKYIVPAMIAAGSGSIINMSSMNGYVANYEGLSAYSTSKGAVRLMNKAVAKDLWKHKIRVNSIHPGTIASTFVAPFLKDPVWSERLIGERVTMGRPGESSEIAKVVAFLASDDSSYMTGSEVSVDGGFVAS
jgi:NAD(P)-dependent dehydrogenase (short-subunit alcohol dehydrogenase family)